MQQLPAAVFPKVPLKESPIRFLGQSSAENVTFILGYWDEDVLVELRRGYDKVTITTLYGSAKEEHTFDLDETALLVGTGGECSSNSLQ